MMFFKKWGFCWVLIINDCFIIFTFFNAPNMLTLNFYLFTFSFSMFISSKKTENARKKRMNLPGCRMALKTSYFYNIKSNNYIYYLQTLFL